MAGYDEHSIAVLEGLEAVRKKDRECISEAFPQKD